MNGRLPQMPLDRPQRTQEWLAGLPVTPQAAETGKQQSTGALMNRSTRERAMQGPRN